MRTRLLQIPWLVGLPWLVWALAIGLLVPGYIGMTVALWTGPAGVPWAIAFGLLGFGAATMGALVASRVPRNTVGWILLALGASVGVLLFAWSSTDLGAAGLIGPLPAVEYVAWIVNWLPVPVLFGSTAFLLLLFPNGRLPSPRWRAVAWFAAASLTLATATSALAPGETAPGVNNPVAPGGSVGEIVRLLYDVADWLALPVMACAAAAMVVRFRRSRGVERQQLKWFTYVATIAGLGLGGSILFPEAVGDPIFLGGLLALAGLPIATGMAILRYRLYAIDVVINKTLVYGTLTLTLGAAYLATILLLQLAMNPLTRGSGLAIAGSTLAVAALFRPARTRIQALVDRRFYRHRYDAQRALDEFGVRLRHELDLETVGVELCTVVRDTIAPAHVTLWLKSFDRNDSRTVYR